MIYLVLSCVLIKMGVCISYSCYTCTLCNVENIFNVVLFKLTYVYYHFLDLVSCKTGVGCFDIVLFTLAAGRTKWASIVCTCKRSTM